MDEEEDGLVVLDDDVDDEDDGLCSSIINLSGELAAIMNTPNFRSQFIHLLADTLQKPVGGIALIVHSGNELCQLGVDATKSVIILNIKAIGHLNAQENVVHAKLITDFLTAQFPNGVIEPSHVLIHFQNLEKHEVAKNGTTVEMLLAGKMP